MSGMMGDFLPGQGVGGDFGSEDGKPNLPMSRGAKRTEELRQLRAALEKRNITLTSLSTRYARAIEALEFVKPQYEKVLALMRKIGWKFEDSEDLNQKVAFTVYTYLVECCERARAVLEEEKKT